MIIDVKDMSAQTFWNHLEAMSGTHTSVTMNINEYVKILSLIPETKFDPEINRDILQKGIYGYIGDMEIRCSKGIPAGQIVFE